MRTQVGNIMTIDGVVEYTTLSKSTIYKKKSNNEIPYHYIGGRTLYMKDEIDNWIRNDGRMGGSLPEIKII
jgi:excisionase family DNA binding protein